MSVVTVSIPQDFESHQKYELNSRYVYVCESVNTLSTSYSLLYAKNCAPRNYLDLKKEFEERKKLIENIYDIEKMIDFVESKKTESVFKCKINPENPITVINFGDER